MKACLQHVKALFGFGLSLETRSLLQLSIVDNTCRTVMTMFLRRLVSCPVWSSHRNHSVMTQTNSPSQCSCMTWPSGLKTHSFVLNLFAPKGLRAVGVINTASSCNWTQPNASNSESQVALMVRNAMMSFQTRIACKCDIIFATTTVSQRSSMPH